MYIYNIVIEIYVYNYAWIILATWNRKRCMNIASSGKYMEILFCQYRLPLPVESLNRPPISVLY